MRMKLMATLSAIVILGQQPNGRSSVSWVSIKILYYSISLYSTSTHSHTHTHSSSALLLLCHSCTLRVSVPVSLPSLKKNPTPITMRRNVKWRVFKFNEVTWVGFCLLGVRESSKEPMEASNPQNNIGWNGEYESKFFKSEKETKHLTV
jgi:hypothetical protein